MAGWAKRGKKGYAKRQENIENTRKMGKILTVRGEKYAHSPSGEGGLKKKVYHREGGHFFGFPGLETSVAYRTWGRSRLRRESIYKKEGKN